MSGYKPKIIPVGLMPDKGTMSGSLNPAPAAYVVDIVRCRDCSHWSTDGTRGSRRLNGPLERIGFCDAFIITGAAESDFCSLAKRRINNGET